MAYQRATPDEVEPRTWYNLTELERIFDCRPITLRLHIRDGLLRARKKGRTWVVLGEEALKWWGTEPPRGNASKRKA